MRREKQILNEDLIRQYRGLVFKLAWQYWKSLPIQTKMWMDPEDLIAEAYLYIFRHEKGGLKGVTPYDPERSSKTTFLWCGINSMLLNLCLYHQTKKRFYWRRSLEDIVAPGHFDKAVELFEAREALEKIFFQASGSLREGMRYWFGPGERKFRRSEEARELYSEFATLARRNRLSIADCRMLLRSGLWVD